MTTKTCTSCKDTKDISEFNKRARSKDGYNEQCRPCISEWRKNRRLELKAQGITPRNDIYNKEHKAEKNTWRANKRKQIRDRIRGLKIHKPCADCGGIFPPTCMDFDHRDPSEKEFNICGDATRELYSNEKIDAEIAKCDLVCANCHRIRSAKQRGEDPAEYDKEMWGL
jgi:hypothetical protein